MPPPGACACRPGARTHAQSVLPLPLVDVIVANVHEDAALDRLVAGCDAVVNLVAILHRGRGGV